MNNELAMRTFAYLISNYKENNETTINSEEIEAIEFLIEENQELKKQLEEFKLDIINGEPYIKLKTVINQQKEFIEYLENMLDNENDIFSVVRVKDVLSKYKEIIGDDK